VSPRVDATQQATSTSQPATSTTLNLSAQPTDAQFHDPAYWNAVLAALNRVVGDALRSVVSSRAVQPSALEALRQVYGSGVFPSEHEAIVQVAAGRAKGLIDPPGDLVASVTGIVKSEARCVALTAMLDFGKVNSTVPTSEVAMELVARDDKRNSINPTPWKIEQSFTLSRPEDRGLICAA